MSKKIERPTIVNVLKIISILRLVFAVLGSIFLAIGFVALYYSISTEVCLYEESAFCNMARTIFFDTSYPSLFGMSAGTLWVLSVVVATLLSAAPYILTWILTNKPGKALYYTTLTSHGVVGILGFLSGTIPIIHITSIILLLIPSSATYLKKKHK